ncbi:MAG: histidine phosphatase family protein [bacterium]
MNTAYFLRHGKLQLPYSSHSEMPSSVLQALGVNTLNPSPDMEFLRSHLAVIQKAVPFEKISRIYTSPSKRTVETAFFLACHMNKNPLPIETLPYIREIPFDLDILFSHTEKKNNTIHTINERILSALVHNEKGCENINSVYQRIQKTYQLLQSRRETVLLITHGFFLRAVEVYAQREHNNTALLYNNLINAVSDCYFGTVSVPIKT